MIRGDCSHRLADNGNGATVPGRCIPFLNDVELTTAWIYDSIAIITEPARNITMSFYRRRPQRSYYHRCPTGGAQGFALAQYYPHLFDWITLGHQGTGTRI